MGASLDLFERVTRRYAKPSFGMTETTVGGDRGSSKKSFCTSPSARSCISARPGRKRSRQTQPKLLIVAPMSGHYATLLRGTVEAMLPHSDVYITDWVDARKCR